MIALSGKTGLHGLDHGGEELVGDVRHNKSDGFFLSGAEAPGGGVRRVAQLRYGPVNPVLGLAGDIPGVVDRVGDGGGGDARHPGHVTDGHFHVVRPLRKR